MNWKPLTDLNKLATLQHDSFDKPVIFVKHSTRCGISSVILDRLNRDWDDGVMEGTEPWVIDVIAQRKISNAVAEMSGVRHESPQLIVIWQGKAIFHTSHMGINFAALKSAVQPLLAG